MRLSYQRVDRLRTAFAFAAALLLLQATTGHAEQRVWTSANGQFSIEADLVKAEVDRVTLKRTDTGKVIQVRLASLCETDQAYIRDLGTAATPVSAGTLSFTGSEPVFPEDDLGSVIDLLPYAKVDDVARPTWRSEGGSLVSGTEFRTQLLFGYEMPQEYELRMDVQIVEGTNSLSVGLPMGDHVALAMIDSFSGQWSGINIIEQKPIRNNPTTFRGRIIRDNEKHELVFRVHERHVHFTLDGETIFDWYGQPRVLWYHDKYWTKDDFPPGKLVLASWGTSWKIDKIELRPILSSATSEIALGMRDQGPERSVALIETESGSGSGFVAGQNLVATNHHVIEGAFVDELRVYIGGSDESLPVKSVLASSKQHDIAILEVETDAEPLPIAWDGVVPKGERVQVYGNPAIDGGVVLRGANVQGTVQSRIRMDRQDYLQIAANVNPGSSGGPVLNSAGQVAGVIVMKAVNEGESILRNAALRFDQGGQLGGAGISRGVALAVPGQTLASILEEVRETDRSRAKRVSVQHNLLAAVDSGLGVAGYEFVRMLGNLSPKLLTQARMRRNSDFEMPPAELCIRLRGLAQDEAFQSGLQKARNAAHSKLERLIAATQNDSSIADRVSRFRSDLIRLRHLADRPPTSINQFEKSVSEIGDRIQENAMAIRKSVERENER